MSKTEKTKLSSFFVVVAHSELLTNEYFQTTERDIKALKVLIKCFSWNTNSDFQGMLKKKKKKTA